MTDLGFALRQLFRNPGFASIALLTLALGMAVNTVMFTVVDAVLFRPLPVQNSERLVRIAMTDSRGMDLGGVSYPQLQDMAHEGGTLAGLAGVTDGVEVNLSIGEAPVERIVAANVSGNFFPLLGLRPAAGRLLVAQDDERPGGQAVAVLSEAFWRRRFGGDASVVGTVVRVNTTAFTVVGVAPRGFFGTSLENVPDIWLPLTMAVETAPMLRQFEPFTRRGFTWIHLIGRLHDGVSASQVRAQFETINRRVNEELHVPAKDARYDRFLVLPVSGAILDPGRLPAAARSSWILLGVTGLVFVIACAVAGGLLLVRGEQRQREIAIRSAVGAPRSRIARLLLAESFLLSAGAAPLSLVLAAWTSDLFLQLAPSSSLLPLSAATPVLSPRSFWFTAALAVASTFLFGLLPAWTGSRPGQRFTTRIDAGGRRGGSGVLTVRNAFVVVQVSLSTVLLVGAGLLLRTLREEGRVDLGFRTENALVVSLDVSKSGYDRERGRQFYARLLEQVRGLPGVTSAAFSRHVPVQSAGMITTVELTNVASSRERSPEVAFSPVSSNYLSTLGLPLVAGRDLNDRDKDGPSVLLVNRAFVDRFWPGRDALRERVLNFGNKGAQVIGVVANAKLTSVRDATEPMIYVPDFAFYVPSTNLVVRTEGDPRVVLPSIRALVQRLDRNVPLFRARTLQDHVALALSEERLVAALLSAFGLLALALAGVGLYGVIAYATQLRGREFGVRVALGATPANLLGLVLAQGAALAAVGVTIGLTVASGASRVLSSFLYGVSPTDGITFAGIAVTLMVVSLLASAAPAGRAARTDPLTTLRAE
ncbi:MAG: ABC transporter permease [Vicinamibacteria bacterium]|nr:ABC transporter permease [Vicinamibacteria bacterium]